MHKVVINVCYGNYILSDEAQKWLSDKYNITDYTTLPRHDSRLVECVETLKDKVNTEYSTVVITEVKGSKYRIQEYDGREWVETPEDLDWINLENDGK